MPLLTLKGANGLKMSYGEIFDKLLVFLTKSTTFLRFLTLKHKNEIKIVQKKTLVPLLTLNGANELKTSYGEIFDKLLVFFDQRTIFLRFLTRKYNNESKFF